MALWMLIAPLLGLLWCMCVMTGSAKLAELSAAAGCGLAGDPMHDAGARTQMMPTTTPARTPALDAPVPKLMPWY